MSVIAITKSRVFDSLAVRLRALPVPCLRATGRDRGNREGDSLVRGSGMGGRQPRTGGLGMGLGLEGARRGREA